MPIITRPLTEAGIDYQAEPRLEFVGCVLDKGEMNYYDDSDFYAVVWDEEQRVVRRVMYATTRAWCENIGCVVDATPETIRKAEAFLAGHLYDLLQESYRKTAAEVAVGKQVVVVKGRNVAHGVVGKVFYLGHPLVYGGPSKWSQTVTRRVGLALTDTKDAAGRYAHVAWTYAGNVEVLEAESLMPPVAEIAYEAALYSKTHPWRLVGADPRMALI